MDIDKFFGRIIDSYLMHDLKNMNLVEQKGGEPGGAIGYPMLATLVSAMELLGGIFYTKEPYSDKTSYSVIYFGYFWNTFLVPCDTSKYTGISDVVWNLVRHGVAHTYIPKVGITVTKEDSPNLHMVPTPDGLNIDCRELYKDFLKAYETARKLLSSATKKGKVQENINLLFGHSAVKAETYKDRIYGERRIDTHTTTSGMMFDQTQDTKSQIKKANQHLNEEIRDNAMRSSGASIARPLSDIQNIPTTQINRSSFN